MSTRIPSQYEYESRELLLATRHEQEIDGAPLQDRREAQQDFFEAMRDRPGVVAERVSWLLDGNYGQGAMLKAQQIFNSPRMNRVAALTQSIGVFEWMCPRRMGIDAWKKLTRPQQETLAAAVGVVIEAAERESRG